MGYDSGQFFDPIGSAGIGVRLGEGLATASISSPHGKPQGILNDILQKETKQTSCTLKMQPCRI